MDRAYQTLKQPRRGLFRRVPWLAARIPRGGIFGSAAGLLFLVWAGCASHSTDDHSALSSSRSTAVLDLKNRTVDPFRSSGHKAAVFIFVRVDCPISNRYAPELERLYQQYRRQGLAFWLVYPDADATPSAIADHLRAFKLSIPVLRDPRHVLVRRAGVSVTPEAAVFLPDGNEIYHGRIDDRFVDFGKERPEPLHRDLNDVLGKIVRNETSSHSETVAIGCYISPVN